MRTLLSKLFKSKITWDFFAGDFSESPEQLLNPARGWYTIYPFFLEREPDFEELRWCLRKEETLAMVIINISAYRECALDEEALERMRRLLMFFASHSYDIILRIVYDHEGNAMEREPFFFKQVLAHMEQILPVVHEFSEHIFVMQGMLVGNWGEMHTSRFVAPEKLKIMWELLQKGLAGRTFLAVRRPSMWRMLHPEECGKEQPCRDNMTLFDDAIFGSESHMGTFGTEPKQNAAWDAVWSRQDELAFENYLCFGLPNGGEAVCGEQYAEEFTPDSTAEVLKQMHITYLNQAHDEKILNLWKQWSRQNGSFYDYVGNYLGYRFCIRKTEICPGKHAGEPEIFITIENTGFANLYLEAEVVLELERENEEVTKMNLETDVRKWDSGSVQCISHPLTHTEGELYLSMRRKTDGRSIYFANTADESGRVYLGRITKQQLP